MNKIFIFIMVLLLAGQAQAQPFRAAYPQPVQSVDRYGHPLTAGARTTAIGDTTVLSNIADTATLVLYRADSGGYVTGTDYAGDMGFAELYGFNYYDSSMTILGVFAEFSGTVSPGSSKIVTFGLWNLGVQNDITSTLAYSGFPQTLLDTVEVPFTQLGIGATIDTLKEFLFAVPYYQASPFFVGYTVNYNFSALDGDTIGLVSSRNGDRQGYDYTIDSNINLLDSLVIDTVINVQNATMQADYNWYDNYTQDDSIYNNLAVFPIVVIGEPASSTGVGITRQNLTFYGAYPNPASESTNIKISLAVSESVAITITDMAGHVIATIPSQPLDAGAHTIPVSTAAMASGGYLYLITTSGGEGIGSKLTVIH